MKKKNYNRNRENVQNTQEEVYINAKGRNILKTQKRKKDKKKNGCVF